jgi:hypothetical protein
MAQDDSNDIGDRIADSLRKHGHIELAVTDQERAESWARACTIPDVSVARAFQARINGQTRWLVAIRTEEYERSLEEEFRRSLDVTATEETAKKWVAEMGEAVKTRAEYFAALSPIKTDPDEEGWEGDADEAFSVEPVEGGSPISSCVVFRDEHGWHARVESTLGPHIPRVEAINDELAKITCLDLTEAVYLALLHNHRLDQFCNRDDVGEAVEEWMDEN